MARIKLLELKLAHERRHKSKPTNEQIALAVFKGEKPPLSDARQKSILARCNTGKEELTHTRLLRLARFFGVTDINLLIAE